MYGIDQKAVVWIESCDGVVLDDNVVKEQGTFGGKLLHTGRNVKGLVDGGSGITEVPPR